MHTFSVFLGGINYFHSAGSSVSDSNVIMLNEL